MERPNKNIQRKMTWATYLAWTFVFLGFVCGIWGACQFDWTGDKGANLALLGSFLQGAVASLWSLGGLLLIYATFLAQKQQLLQQDEELEDQKKQFELQQESIRRQNFERSYFHLLNLHNQVVNDIWWGESPETGTTGRAALKDVYERLKRQFLDAGKGQEEVLVESESFVNQVYLTFYVEVQDLLGHYFRTLYHLFKFVDSSEVGDKRRYTSLVRAQLSSHELALLHYSGISFYGRKRFKPLIEKYGLLENMDIHMLLSPEHGKFYEKTAYE